MTKIERFRGRRLSNGSARIMVSMLREAGIRPEPALAEAGLALADVERPDGIVGGDQELRLERAFVERTRDHPDLWLDVGFRYRRLSYGPFGLAILSARTVARAVEFKPWTGSPPSRFRQVAGGSLAARARFPLTGRIDD